VINIGIGIRVRREAVVIYCKETCRQADRCCKLFMTVTKTRCQFVSKCHDWNWHYRNAVKKKKKYPRARVTRFQKYSDYEWWFEEL